jgi:Protein of unknown function (DUF2490)
MCQSSHPIKNLALAAALALAGITAAAQTQWKNWNSLNLSVPVTKKLELRAGHLRAYNISEKYRNEFNQTAISANYELTRRIDITGGVQFIKPTTTGADTRTRIFVRGSYGTKLGNRFRWTNSLHIETNSKAETRFRQRIIASTRLALRKRLDFLRLTPSATYSLFYNIGGNPVSYYDETGARIARQTPDGFHRSRFTFSLNSKVNDYFRVTAFVMMQREFNFLASDTRKMNVFNPVRNRITRPFDNFNVIGLSLNVSLDDLISGD